MLRSPLANPMTTPMINPIRTGLSKITRAILNFNGTQHATLSEPVVLDGDFEIEMLVYVRPWGSWDTWLSGNGFRFSAAFGADNETKRSIAFQEGENSVTIGNTTNAAIAGQLNRVVLKRSGADWSLSTNNGDTVTTTGYSSGSVSITTIGKNVSGAGSGDSLVGSIFSSRIWKGGDRNTGELVTNLRFDEPNTTLQRNYAYPNSNFLYNSETDEPFPVNSTGAEVVKLPAGGWEVRLSDSYESGTITARIDFVDLPPGRYKFYFEGARSGDVAFMIRRRSNGTNYAFFPLDTTREGWFNHDDPKGLYIQIQIYYPSEDSFARIDKLIIQEWDGAILNNVLPGDWEEISKKSGDNFWTGDGGRVIEYAEGAL